MANAITTQPTKISVLNILAAPFVALANAMIYLTETNSNVQRVQTLQALSDEQLAERGLKREDIVRHVFASHMGF